ncbi:NosD domain-containing protein [Bacillus sp. DTU_2020_1000418_1_SI_GHA_SEK_038]|uniref:right-handed parallel beta-helix repeat-containing protein n=1 Tax=Bacillus sp. DTU_2020_1000418_1_SI_GHA_SEK_038 TaxID=3077585 RepID=UPI0028EADBDC|nr:NosD domain-containing protein [Bacillus sp. DTU_2020_1000418_1_SI_GHA_SEK_038]WNS73579.1 NosD domain-containing protein [Bacillus sp. DTU_2020_1000418_1_SI_GHA_SEK_038]
MNKKVLLFIVCAWFFFAGKVHGAEVTVSNTKELQGALLNPTSSVINLKTGEYIGPLTITHSVQLIGEKGAKIIGPYEGNVLTIDADDVTVEGLQIEGSGSQNAGIYIKGNRSHIHHNLIRNVFHGIYAHESYGHRFEQNTITSFEEKSKYKGYGIYLVKAPNTSANSNLIFETQDGVYVSYSEFCELKGNQMIRTRYGVHTMDSRNVLISQNQVRESVNGLMIMQSYEVFILENIFYLNTKVDGAGMFIYDTFDSKIASNVVMSNYKGILMENAKRNRIEFNTFLENDTGLELRKNSDQNYVYLNNFYQNTKQIISDSKNVNKFSKDQYGNYFDDHQSLSLNKDKIVDFAYKSGDVFYNMTNKEPYLQIFHRSPAVELWNMIEKFTPIPSDTFVIDEYPLMNPAPVNWEKSQSELSYKEKRDRNFSQILSFLLILSVCSYILFKFGREKHEV